MTLPHKNKAASNNRFWHRVKSHVLPANDDAAEQAFLPAALELVETPPSPAGRLLVYLICSFFVCVIAWSYFGKVDMVATAQGQIAPSGQTKLIQPLEIGTVSKIDVKDGEQVTKGQMLIELDPTGSRADAQRAYQEMMQDEVDAARLSAMAQMPDNASQALAAFHQHLPQGAAQTTLAHADNLLQSTLAGQAATLSGIQSDMAQKQAENAQIMAEIAKLEQTLPLIKKRSDMRRHLIAKGYSSVMEASRAEQSLIESRKTIVEDKAKRDANEAALKSLHAKREETVSKFKSETLAKQVEASRKADDARQQWIKTKDLLSRRVLTAPVDGTVQQLAVHTVGGVVTPAQQLMVIVPKDVKLEVEAMIQNKDIGFVHEGQKVELKLETFPFTRYGLRHGTVINISRDAVTPTKTAQNSANSNVAARTTTPPASKDSLYKARISLDKTSMMINGTNITLTPGMTITAEIKTGKQRILQYLLDPMLRYQHDSFHER